MKIAYFDCFSGASGDMILGALLDAGLDRDAFLGEITKLELDGWRLQISTTRRHSIAAIRFEVEENVDSEDDPFPGLGEPDDEDAHDGDHDHHHGHHHEHVHHHDHDHDHDHSHPHGPHSHGRGDNGHGSHPHRGLKEIREILDASDLDEEVRAGAIRIFERLAEAEARAHRIPASEVHFHEVGAIDAIIDIVGAVIALRLLGVEAVYVSPLPAGRGFVDCDHGKMPLPAPGTLELLKGVPIVPSSIEKELVTPTGAAILTTLADGFGGIPEMVVDAVGYGAGKRDLPEQPNLLRVLIGRTGPEVKKGLLRDRIAIIETNIDDQSPETFGYLVERLLEEGALDATFTPILMKKGRPAHQLTVLAEPKDAERLSALVLAETTSFGVRVTEASRWKLARRELTVETSYGPVRVKVGWADEIWKVAPEFEDCLRLAKEKGVPIREIYDAAVQAYRTPPNVSP